MSNRLHQLDRPQALLLYAADELSHDERAEVERRIGADPAWAAELQRVRGDAEWLAGAMGELDRGDAPPAPSAAIEREVVRAMRQWHVDRASAEAGNVARRGWRIPSMMEVAVSAAILLLCAGVIAPVFISLDKLRQIAGDPAPPVVSESIAATAWIGDWDPAADDEALPTALLASRDTSLSRIEQELQELQELGALSDWTQ